MTPGRRFACCCLALGLTGGCAARIQLLKAPHSEPDAAVVILAADIRIWGRFGRQSLPLRHADLAATRLAREALAAHLAAAPCPRITAAGEETLDQHLALYQRVATAWLANPAAARAGLSVGSGLTEFSGGCATALILLGQQLPQPAEASNWLSLGAIDVANGKLLRLAAVPIGAEDDLRRPEVLRRRIGQLLERIYR